MGDLVTGYVKIYPSDVPVLVDDLPVTAGGLKISRVISAASTNATVAKATPGQIYEIFASNLNALPRYLKIYNKATSPTVGTDIPVITLLIPGSPTGGALDLSFIGGTFIASIEKGIEFLNGISYALTTGVANTDTGAVAANEILITIMYK